jgi:hypothetical protein
MPFIHAFSNTLQFKKEEYQNQHHHMLVAPLMASREGMKIFEFEDRAIHVRAFVPSY